MNFPRNSTLLKPVFKINRCFFCPNSGCGKAVTKCVVPPTPPMSITIIGANSCVGKISGMLLKTQKVFKKMYLYDTGNTEQICNDLNTANYVPIAKSFCGVQNLEAAVKNCRILYICGGIQTSPGYSEQDLFDRNVPFVRQAVTYCSEFNPNAHVVISTPPVSYLVPMAVEEFRKSNINAERRVYGIVRTLVSRANSMAAIQMKGATKTVNSFVIGGAHRRTFVPILSHIKPGNNEHLIDKIQDAEDCALRQKMRDNYSEGCCLSIAYSGVLFTTLLAQALLGTPKLMDCAFVKQHKPMDEYAKYFSCLVEFDIHGVKSCHIPKMSQEEKNRLKKVMTEIQQNIYLGSSYVTGDDMVIVRVPPKPEKIVKVEKVVKKKQKDDKCPPYQRKIPKKLTILVDRPDPCD